jgi:hypothetical protein
LIAVTDTGAGMAQAIIDKAFEPALRVVSQTAHFARSRAVSPHGLSDVAQEIRAMKTVATSTL